MDKIERYGDFEKVNGKTVNEVITQLEAVNEINKQLSAALRSSQENKSETNENIYDMNLNDSIYTTDLIITRVPGGWLYSKMETYDGQTMALPPVFVPFHKEFDAGKNMEVVDFPEVEKTEGIDLEDDVASIYREIKKPEQCQINCQYLDEDQPIDEEDRSLFNCTVKHINNCPIVIQKLAE